MDHTAEILKAKYHQQPKLNVHDISQLFNTATSIEDSVTLESWITTNKALLSSVPMNMRAVIAQEAQARWNASIQRRVSQPDPYLTIQPRGFR